MLTGRGRREGCSLSLTPVFLVESGPGEDDSLWEGSTGGNGRVFETMWWTWKSGSSGLRIVWLYELDGQSTDVARAKDGVCTGVCCPLARGVDQASKKCE